LTNDEAFAGTVIRLKILSATNPRVPTKTREDWNQAITAVEENGPVTQRVVVECYAKVRPMSIDFFFSSLSPVQARQQLPIPSGSVSKAVWCMLENPYLAVRKSRYDGEERLVVTEKYGNKLSVLSV